MRRASRRLVLLSAAALLIVPGFRILASPTEPAGQAPAARSIIDPMVLKSMQWRSIGPARAGRSIAVSGVKGRPKEAYSGRPAAGCGRRPTAARPGRRSPTARSTARRSARSRSRRRNPDIVFIGMGESCIRGNIQPGDGVYKSTDAGKTWTHVGFADSQAISKIRIHPTNPDIVFVAVVRQVRRAERRARHLQEHRRRQDLAARCCSATTRPAASTSRSIRTTRT